MTRARKLIVWAMLSTIVVGVLAVLFWPVRCQVDVGLLSVESADVYDEAGKPFWLVTAGLTNRGAMRTIFDPRTSRVEARMGDRWTGRMPFLSLASLNPAGAMLSRGEAQFLVPQEAVGCRLRLQFDIETPPWVYRLPDWLGRVWPSLYKRLMIYYFDSQRKPPQRHWRPAVTPEITLSARGTNTQNPVH